MLLAMAPQLLQAGMGTAQLISGMNQARRARPADMNLLQTNIQQQMQTVAEAQQRAARAQDEARYGFMPAQRSLAQSGIDSQLAAQTGNIRNMGGSRGQMMANLTNLGLQGARAQTGLEAQDAEMQMQRQQYADVLGQQVGAERGRAFGLRDNVFNAQDVGFQRQTAAARAMQGAGIQNIQGGIQGGFATLNQENTLNPIQQGVAATSEGVGYGAVKAAKAWGGKDGGEVPGAKSFDQKVSSIISAIRGK